MPRIAASLAVLLTAVTCIGFNTARYPAVWQMVAGGDGLAQSDPSDDPAAAPQSESLAQSAAEAESAPSWQSDWQSDDDRTDSTDWESTTVEPSSAYASYEEGDSYGDSGEKSYGDSDEESYRYSDETPYQSDGGSYDTNTACSPGYGQDELAGTDDYDPDANDEDESAAGNGYNSWGNDEDAVISPTDEPVKAPASARYASYPFGVYGNAPDPSPASSGDALAQRDTDEGGQLVPQSTLVPVKPATTQSNGGESLARRPWANSLSLPDHVGSSGTSEVVPLPPVDEVSTLGGSEARSAVAEDAIRIYPTTMVE